MRDAILTIRMPAETKKRLEDAARKEGRSLSGQAFRLIERGLEGKDATAERPQRVRSLSAVLHVARVPELSDFREIRRALSRALSRESKRGDVRR